MGLYCVSLGMQTRLEFEGLCDNLEQLDGMGSGRGIQEGRHIGIPMADPW